MRHCVGIYKNTIGFQRTLSTGKVNIVSIDSKNADSIRLCGMSLDKELIVCRFRCRTGRSIDQNFRIRLRYFNPNFELVLFVHG